MNDSLSPSKSRLGIVSPKPADPKRPARWRTLLLLFLAVVWTVGTAGCSQSQEVVAWQHVEATHLKVLDLKSTFGTADKGSSVKDPDGSWQKDFEAAKGDIEKLKTVPFDKDSELGKKTEKYIASAEAYLDTLQASYQYAADHDYTVEPEASLVNGLSKHGRDYMAAFESYFRKAEERGDVASYLADEKEYLIQLVELDKNSSEPLAGIYSFYQNASVKDGIYTDKFSGKKLKETLPQARANFQDWKSVLEKSEAEVLDTTPPSGLSQLQADLVAARKNGVALLVLLEKTDATNINETSLEELQKAWEEFRRARWKSYLQMVDLFEFHGLDKKNLSNPMG